MTGSDGMPRLDEERFEELPTFDLRFLLDDGKRPSSVTLYDPDSLETAWITVDMEAAMSLDDLR
ncbi:hypothetical protein BRC97_05090 [Halobacteriales archaeon QS_6_71_20]|nr:MAG: hypothetical protein BRC97_05090 [Halobacteriales archaeon QS_6_71_20]